MFYTLSLAGEDRHTETWSYDTTENRLFDSEWNIVKAVYPNKRYGVLGENPWDFTSIRIILGMGCNYRCQYCAQAEVKKSCHISMSSYEAKKYARKLRSFYDEHCNHAGSVKFSLWGGEPLLYFNRFIPLHQELLEAFEDLKTTFYFCTNGKLLKGDVARYLIDNRCWLTLSYDGPGQWVRNPYEDVLAKGTETREAFLEGMTKNFWSIAGTLNRYNPSLRDYVHFMTDTLGTERWILADAVDIRVGDEASLQVVCTPEQYEKELIDRTRFLLEAENDPALSYIMDASYTQKRIYRFCQWLGKKEVPVSDCIIADNRQYLHIDLEGNSWGCQNLVGTRSTNNGESLWGGNIIIGEYRSIDNVSIHTAERKYCNNCLLRTMCGAGCRLLPSKYDEVNCRNNRLMYYPLFVRTLKAISGMTLVNVEVAP